LRHHFCTPKVRIEFDERAALACRIYRATQSLGVLAIILIGRAKNQSQPARMRNQDACGERLQKVVKVAISTARLVADLKSVRQALQGAYQLLDRPNSKALMEQSWSAIECAGHPTTVQVIVTDDGGHQTRRALAQD